MPNLTNIPAPRVDFIDKRTGLMAREWYLFLLNLFTLVGGGSNNTSLSDLQVGPPSPSIDEINAIVKAIFSMAPPPEPVINDTSYLITPPVITEQPVNDIKPSTQPQLPMSEVLAWLMTG